MKETTDRIVELLVSAVSGGLDTNGANELEQWLDADAANRELYARLSDERHLADQYSVWSHTRADDGWQQMRALMTRSENRRKRFALLRKAAPYVSAAAILVAGLFVYISLTDHKGSDPYIAAQHILPGRNVAVIELETGEVVPLDDRRPAAKSSFSSVGRMVGDSILDYSDKTGIAPIRPSAKHTLKVPEGAGTKCLTLSDGTVVWLNAGSTLTYPVAFEGGERVVAMTGEGYFEVHSDENAPFLVESQGITVRVTGTQFNIMSYPDEGSIETTLVEGVVNIVSYNKSTRLSPGVQAVFEKSSGDMSIRDVDPRIYTAWKEGVFEFDDMAINDICHVLSRWYDVEFKISKTAGSTRFTGTIDRNKPLGFILDLIRDTETIDYAAENDKVSIKSR